MKTTSLVTRACALTLWAISPFFSHHANADANVPGYEPALRDLWQRGTERFHRQWLIAGPIEARDAKLLSASDLKPPQAGEALSNAPASPRWESHTAWTDITELSTIAGRAITTAQSVDRYVFVAAIMTRAQASDEDLMIGSERPYTAWLNGKEIQSRETAEGFLLDRHRVPVTLNSGDNLVLLRIHETSIGPTQISLRGLPRGTPVANQHELAPIVLQTASGTLAVQTHFSQDESPVEVVVRGAGGRSVATRRAKRGEVVRFETKGWRTGAYEIRVSSLKQGSGSVSKVLPWYQGNAIDAVRALVDAAAAAGDDVHGDTVRMLAAMAQDRLGGSIQNVTAAAWRLVHSPLLEFEEMMLERRGEPAAVRGNGFVRLAYTDGVDGSTQFCRAYLPRDYAPKKRWPLIAALHGFNPANPEYIDWWSVDERRNAIADQRATIVVEPHGRGNAQYNGIGERDVLRCIEEAKRRFSVDADRVYLTGESMGGHGTWYIASRNPDVFAAAAPVYGGWDFRVTNVSGPPIPREPRNAVDAYSSDRASSFASAENLLHVPLLVVHGDADAAVVVENSRHAVRMLQRWGYNIRYHEMPGWGHEDLGQRLTIADWLLSHTRVKAPRTVRLRSPDLSAASAYWFNVRAFERPGEVVRVEAQVLEPGVLRVDSSNVASFAVDLPADLHGQKQRLQVHWNGQLHESKLQNGQAVVELKNAVTPKTKRAGLEGPMHDVLATPFMIVVGTTSSDPRMREIIQSRADTLAHEWREWQKQPLRIVRDTELSADDEKRYSLLLLGNAESNAITQRYARALPFEVSENRISMSGREWSGKDVVLQMIYPSPVATDRYVYVIAPTSTAGMYFAKPQLVNFRIGFPVTAFDWVIQDGRRAPSGTMSPMDTFVAAGIFDAHWRYDEAATIERDQASASKWTVRRLPPKGFAPPEATLQALTGRYEVFPGVEIDVRLENGALMVVAPEGRIIPLNAESDTLYVDPTTGNTAEFLPDEQGNIDSVSVENDGAVFLAKRKNPPQAMN